MTNEVILRFRQTGVMAKMGNYAIIRTGDPSEPCVAYVHPTYAKQVLEALNREAKPEDD